MCLWKSINEQNLSKSRGRPLPGCLARRARPYGEVTNRHLKPRKDNYLAKLEVGEAVYGPVECRSLLFARRTGVSFASQRAAVAVMAERQIPHGVESAPEAVEGTSTEPGNLLVDFRSERRTE